MEKWEGGDGDEGNSSNVTEGELDDSPTIAEPRSDEMVVDSAGDA